MTDLHLVWSWSAAGSLRGALRQKKNVMRADQRPDLGPLDDGRRRGSFFRDLWTSVGTSPDEFGDDFLPVDAYLEWNTIRRTIADTNPDRVLIWTSNAAADHVFLRMATYLLKDFQQQLWQILIKDDDYFRPVSGMHGDVLLSFLPAARKIDTVTARTYNTEFASMAANPGLLRWTTSDGRLTYHDLSFFDQAIIGYCSREWTRVLPVVGDTMGHADSMPDDILIFSRVLHLVKTGKLELDGEYTSVYEESFRQRRIRVR